jgi:D-tyrosyl-tRNA(Tyr) deacylase
MRVVLQRVKRGSVSIDGHKVAEIGSGLVLLVGIAPQDTEEQARYLANKIANLRVFEDEAGKMNRSVLEVGGEAIVVSQFTLFADTRKGRRPSYIGAAPPEIASPIVDRFAQFLSMEGVPTQEGEFGAMMEVEIINDGPVTIWMERE